MSLNIAKALQIGGVPEQELLWLAGQAIKHQCIVELGTGLGQSTRALTDNTLGMVTTVDKFREDALDEFITNVTDVVPGRLVVLIEDPCRAASQWSLGSIDMLFVNEYSDTVADWLPLIDVDGLICGRGELPMGAERVDGTSLWYFRK